MVEPVSWRKKGRVKIVAASKEKKQMDSLVQSHGFFFNHNPPGGKRTGSLKEGQEQNRERKGKKGGTTRRKVGLLKKVGRGKGTERCHEYSIGRKGKILLNHLNYQSRVKQGTQSNLQN